MKLSSLPNNVFIFLITAYQRYLAPGLPKVCRFTPSCSQYGVQAFKTYSFFKALWLTIYRILRCNPFNTGGYDPLA